jgi:steroid delta-isomerase-like uncharacterized protein
MSDPKAIVRRFVEAWNADAQHIVDDLAAPDLVVSYTHWSAPAQGPEAFKEILTQSYAVFPDMRIQVHDVLAEGNRVMVRWSFTGTHQQGEMFGKPPTGKPVDVPGISIYRIAGDKVLEESGVVDNFTMMRQLGVTTG